MEQQYWEEQEEAVLEEGLRRRNDSRRQENEETAAATAVNGKNDTATLINGTGSMDVNALLTNTVPDLIGLNEILMESPMPQLPLKTSLPGPGIRVNTSRINGTASNGNITTVQESKQHYTDLYLEPTFQKLPTQEFFCPNCNTCIRKVVLRDSDWQFIPSRPAAPEPMVIGPLESEPFRCTSCFSFLIPVGSWFNTLIRAKKEDSEEEAGRDPLLLIPGRDPLTTKIPQVEKEGEVHKEAPGKKPSDQGKKGSLTNKNPLPSPRSKKVVDQIEKASEKTKDPLPFVKIEGGVGREADEQIEDDRVDKARRKQEPPLLEEVVIHENSSEEKNKSRNLGPIVEIPAKVKEKQEAKRIGRGPGEREDSTRAPTVAGPSASTAAEASIETGGEDKGEILKSIVYGGLAESITSLSVVASAAGSNVDSLKIIALALANLIGGLFVIIHNIWDLKAEQARTVSNENEQVDRYQKLLGQRKNFALHATFALLSFLVFGAEPPLVYGFSFRESENRDYKLAVVAGVSFICISLLALGKAHIQKPSSYHAYVKTLTYYLVIGFAASGVSYVAGDLIKKLLYKLGLFKSESETAIFLALNDVRAANPAWSSY